MKILKKQYYICVDSKPDLGAESFCVTIGTNLKSMLRGWGATTRISPIWQLRPTVSQDELKTDADIGDPVSLWFLHGISAEFLRDQFSQSQLAILYDESMWISVGVHSLVLVCRNEQLDEDIRNICYDHSVPFERWLVEEADGKGSFSGKGIEYYSPESLGSSSVHSKTKLANGAFSKANIELDDALGFMQFELYALLAVMEGRSQGPFSVLADDAMKVEELAYELVNGQDEVEHDAETGVTVEKEATSYTNGMTRPDILLTLNAGLSRLSSQALSGTSPILRTECHFWPHSFLGTGVANLALRNVAQFLTSLTTTSRYDQRLYALAQEEFNVSRFSIEKPDEQFPDFACINRKEASEQNSLDSISDSSKDLDEAGDAATPITYFSGRDGFMNGALTTSAPLPSVSGCNSYQWNLGTITHEISHRILGGHIFDCIDEFLDEIYQLQHAGSTGVAKVNAFFRDAPVSYGSYASKVIGRVLMLYNCLGFDETEMKTAMSQPFDFFVEANDRHADNIEELLVHIFDFYHFYGSDTETYCTFVWLSWAVLPSIEEKFEDYVVRTLVALGVKYLGRDDWKELAISDFLSVLSQEPLKSRLHIQPDIVALLNDTDQRFEILQYLDMSEPLVVLFHVYFKSDVLSLGASEDLYSNPENRTVTRNGRKEKRYYHYRFPVDAFASENPSVGRPRFTNPLLFLRDYSREELPNAAQSAWLLHMLAFNLDWERAAREDVS